MGFFDFLDPNRESIRFLEEVQRKLQETALECSLIEQGWTPIPEGMTEEQQQAVIDDVGRSGKITLYPPGYIEPPIITEGKLEVEPEPEEEERKWWQLW